MKIAGIQFSCSDNKEKNTEKACKMMDMAVEQGAKIVSFQELFNLHWFPRTRDESAFDLAEEMGGPTVSRMAEKAKGCDAVVVLPFFEKEKGSFYNSCAVIDADGKRSPALSEGTCPRHTPVGREILFFRRQPRLPCFRDPLRPHRHSDLVGQPVSGSVEDTCLEGRRYLFARPPAPSNRSISGKRSLRATRSPTVFSRCA